MQATSPARDLRLEGFRGIAVLLVVCYHYLGVFNLCQMGWMGVDFFFVLSGCLISRSFERLRDEAHGVWKFYLNRFLRVVPLYLLLIFCFYVLLPWMQESEKSFYIRHWAYYFLFAGNFILTDNMLYLRHLWSLGVEMQFYILAPVILMIRPAKLKIAALLCVIMLIILTRIFLVGNSIFSAKNHEIVQVFRFDAFFIGCLIFYCEEILRHLKLWFIPLIFILYIIFCYYTGASGVFSSTHSYAGFTVISLFAAYIILYRHESVARKILRAPALVRLGALSYAIYLFHWPLLQLSLIAVNKLHIFTAGSRHLIATGLAALTTYFAAILSEKYFEPLFMKFKV